MKTRTKTEPIEFKDCIHHTTTTKFPFWQRVKHLLGAPVMLKSEIHCQNEVGYIKAKAVGMHTRIFPKKSKGRCVEQISYTPQNEQNC